MLGMLPAPPPDGGFLVLNDAQIGNLDLVCAIKSTYPQTKIYAQSALPREVCHVMRMGNPRPGEYGHYAPGMLGHYMRRFPDNRRILINAMKKLKAR